MITAHQRHGHVTGPRLLALLALLLASLLLPASPLAPTPAQALNNGLALKPPMGWNSWNRYACNISESLIKTQADAMVSSGMRAAGYQYINLDDCWQTSRDSAGNIIADPVRFPSGIKALADYVHARGLKLGIYSDRGTQTCAGRPGSQGYEAQDARSYAAWGVDYLKYDNCYATLDMRTQYETMRNALAASGRPIVYSICAWQFQPWMPDTGNLWRTTGDIMDSWSSIMGIMDENNKWAVYAKPGAWNDPDMLMVGNYGTGAIGGGGMTDTEYRTHFSMWALMGAPLIAGNDLATMNQFTRDTLTNPEVIALNQDALGLQGYRARDDGDLEVWSKKLQGTGLRGVALLNRGGAAANITVNWTDLGLAPGSATVRDLWARADRGTFSNSFTASVPPHGVVMLRVAGGEGPTPVRIRINKTDTRAIANLRISTTFVIDGANHYDWEDTGTFDHITSLGVNGNNATWNAGASRWEGNLLLTQSTAAGGTYVDINKVDPRAITRIRVEASFTINGAQHYDFEDVVPWSTQANLVLNANGGTFNSTTGRWEGNFLRR